MKVLITGGSSLLGKSLLETKPKEAVIESTWYTNHVGLPMYQMDVCDKSQVRYVFDRVKPDIVIHCAANGSVDFAEQNYAEAYQVNATGTGNILWAAEDYRAKVVYISTNAVYDGSNPPYTEESELHPINAYGSIKKQAEEKVRTYKWDWLIFRPFLLYGWPWPGGRQNWATLVINKLSRGELVKLVNDVYWQPTYSKDCAKAIWNLINDSYEIYQVAGAERITLYEFGLKVAKVFGLDQGLVEPVDSDYFPTIAPRPRDTHYCLDKLNKAGVEIPDIEAGLRRMKRCQKTTK